MSTKNLFCWVLGLGLAVAGLVSCVAPGTPTPAAPTPAPSPAAALRGRGGTLQMLLWDAPTILNPHLVITVKDWVASRITYEPLASYDADGHLVPYLAAEIPSRENGEVAADGQSVTWKLKPGLHWSDGEPFSAEDVAFTYQYIVNPAVNSPSAPVYDAVASVEAPETLTVRVNFKSPNPAWAIPFVGAQGVILPKHVFAAYNGANAHDAPANTLPVGTGPYRVLAPGIKQQEVLLLGSELVQTNKIVYEPNPYFRDADKPYFSRIELRGGGTASEAARLSLQTGQVDFAWDLNLTASELQRLQTTGVGRVLTSFGSRVEQIELNRTDPNRETADGERSSLQFPHPILSDPQVRQALAYAIDRDAIVALYGPAGQLARHILVSPPQFESAQTFYTYDPQKAAALLDAAGWRDTDGDGIRDKDGKKLHLLFQGAVNAARQDVQRIVQKNLQAIGVEVEVKIIDASVYYGSDVTNPSNVQQFRADLQEYDWTSVNPDPGLFLQYWLCAQAAQKANNWSGSNSSRWCHPAYDALYAQSKTELDPAKRAAIFVQMNDLLSEEVALIPLVRPARVSGVNAHLQGLAPTPWDTDTWNIQDWSLSTP